MGPPGIRAAVERRADPAGAAPAPPGPPGRGRAPVRRPAADGGGTAPGRTRRADLLTPLFGKVAHMKRWYGGAGAALAVGLLALAGPEASGDAVTGPLKLFNGKDLTNFYTYL